MEVSGPKGFSGHWWILDGKIQCSYLEKSFDLIGNVREIKVYGHKAAVSAAAGRDGLPRAAAGAVLGFLIAGPVGTVLGAGAGASGADAGQRGRAESYSIFLKFKNYQYLIGEVSSTELEQLRSFLDVPAQPSIHSTESAVSATASPATAKPDAYAALPEPIKGRATKQKPFPISKLTKKLGRPPESQAISLFFRHLQVALDSLNTIKWRYYNQEVEGDLEITEIVAVALSATSQQIRQLTSLAKQADEVIDLLAAYFSALVPENEARKAWSKPKPSSVISKTGALKIFKKCRSFDTQPETVSNPEIANSQNDDALINVDEIERKLNNLKKLLGRGVISEDEYSLARMKILGI